MEGLLAPVIQRNFVHLLLGLPFLLKHVKTTSVSAALTSPGFAAPPSGTDCLQGVSVPTAPAWTRIPPPD